MYEEGKDDNARLIAEARQMLRIPVNKKQKLIQRLATLRNEYIPVDEQGRPMDIRLVTQRRAASLAPRRRAAALARSRKRQKERLGIVLEAEHEGADHLGRTMSPRGIHSNRIRNLIGKFLGSASRRKHRRKTRRKKGSKQTRRKRQHRQGHRSRRRRGSRR